MLVIEASSESKRLEAGVGVVGDVTPYIIVDSLCDAAVGDVDDEPGAAEVVADDAVGVATLDHVVRDVGLGAVDESCDHVACSIQLGDGVELVLIQETLCEGVVCCSCWGSCLTPAYRAMDQKIKRNYSRQHKYLTAPEKAMPAFLYTR